jgi:hypothetical protein
MELSQRLYDIVMGISIIKTASPILNKKKMPYFDRVSFLRQALTKDRVDALKKITSFKDAFLSTPPGPSREELIYQEAIKRLLMKKPALLLNMQCFQTILQ